MNACHNGSCFPTSAVARSVLQQVNQSTKDTEDGTWLMVNMLKDRFFSVDNFLFIYSKLFVLKLLSKNKAFFVFS